MDRPRFSFSLADKRVSIGLCTLGLLLFAILSYSAMHGKSATYDETTHSVGGYIHAKLGDFRINPEDPALFGYWGALAQSNGDLIINKDLNSWDGMLTDFATNQWIFSNQTLFQTPGNNGDAFLQRSRFMFTILGVGLGALIATWSWKLAGPVAATLACGLFCFDPNFAAHSSLFKNDVMLSFMLLSLSFSLWRFGQRGTIWSLIAIALTAAAAINVKFSGVLCGPIILVVLGARALMPTPWTIFRRPLQQRWQRLLAVAAVCGCVAATCYVGTWAVYDFRYAITTDPGAVLNVDQVVQRARASKTWAEMGENHTPQEVLAVAETKPIPIVARVLKWAMDHQLLPQSWLFGFLFTYATTQIRSAYLLGGIRITGYWYYFPCCILFKTPTATLASVLLVPGVLLWQRLQRRRADDPNAAAASNPRRGKWSLLYSEQAWTLICFLVPTGIYIGSAMSTNLNLGLRHILPIYPFWFVAIGCGLSIIVKRQRRMGVILSAVLLGGLAAESLAAYPDYLAFFNLPSGGSRGGFTKLGDSNLDWGQDLKGLAAWQKDHNNLPMYLAYFGTASPAAYGVHAYNVPGALGGWPFDPNPQMPQTPCYFAVSATNLQSIYINNPQVMAFYAQFQKAEPIAVIGGSIYIYQLPLAGKR